MWLFKTLHAAGGKQGSHLGDGDVVESGEAVGLWQTLADEHGVQAFEVGEDDELFERGVVADVSLGIRVCFAPLFDGLTEKGDVEEVRLTGIDGRGLGFGDGGWDESVLDGIGVDSWLSNSIEFDGIRIGIAAVDRWTFESFFGSHWLGGQEYPLSLF